MAMAFLRATQQKVHADPAFLSGHDKAVADPFTSANPEKFIPWP